MKDALSSRWRRAESAGSEGTEAEATGGRLHRPLAAQLAPELPAYAPTFPCPGAVPKAKGEARKRASEACAQVPRTRAIHDLSSSCRGHKIATSPRQPAAPGF